MNRVNFVNGIELNANDFDYEQGAIIEGILARTRHLSQVGIRSGLVVSVYSDNLSLSVSAGDGYCGDSSVATQSGTSYGEYVQLANGTILSPPAGGWVAGTTYYVNMVYTENEQVLKPNEDGITSNYSQFVQATDASQLEIITLSAYNALTDLQKQARLRIGVVTVLSSGTLAGATVLSLSSFSQYSGAIVLYASQPVNVTGVQILQLSGDNGIGNGILYYTNNAGLKQLSWQAPGTNAPGNPVTITGDGYATLYAQNGVTWIKVLVTVTILASANAQDTIIVQDLYKAIVAKFSANDVVHRNMIGTGRVTATNPHGLSINDITGSVEQSLKSHMKVEHSNGIQSATYQALTPTVVHNISPIPDYVNINGISVGSAGSESVFISGNEFDSMSGFTASFPASLYSGAYNDLIEIGLRYDGTPVQNLRAQYAATQNITNCFVYDVSQAYQSTIVGNLYWNAANQTLSWQSGGAVTITGTGNYILYDADGLHSVMVSIVGALPATNKVDQIVINAPMDVNQNLVICNVVFNVVTQEIVNYVGSGMVGNAYDKRLWGTLSARKLRSDIVWNTGKLMFQMLDNMNQLWQVGLVQDASGNVSWQFIKP